MMHNTGTTTGALSVDGPQPVWRTLDEARERCFTGELVFETDPEVRAYLDAGVVYYAERTTDPALGRRLLAAGVVDHGQLERGTVRVGDIEHLGRLFDREPSVDRDAVVVTTEVWTEELVTEVANQAVATVRVTAYRHHPSGLHRWFVATPDVSESSLPLGSVAPLVVDELPGMPGNGDDLADELTIEWDEPFDGSDEVETLPVVHELDVALFDELLDHRDEADTDAVLAELAETPSVLDEGEVVTDDVDAGVAVTFDDVEQPAIDEAEATDEADATAEPIELDEPVHEESSLVTSIEDVEAVDAEDVDVEDAAAPAGAAVDGFALRWPDGTEEVAGFDGDDVADDMVADDMVADDMVADDMVVEDMAETHDVSVVEDMAETHDVSVVEAVPVEPSEPDALVTDQLSDVEMPDVEMHEDGTSDVEASDDVADAVRRAIAAIESTSLDVADFEPIDLDDSSSVSGTDDEPVLATEPVLDVAEPAVDVTEPVVDEVAPVLDVTEPATDLVEATAEEVVVEFDDVETRTPESAFAGFAPPTPDMAAEVIYARQAAEMQTTEAAESLAGSETGVGQAPVVIADEPPAAGDVQRAPGGGSDRMSALRRLISSLGRKDR